MNPILDDLLHTLPNGCIIQVLIGLHWTAVVTETNGALRCGLASTLAASSHRHGEPDVPQAGQLAEMPARELARLAASPSPLPAAIGIATINSLLAPDPAYFVDINAADVLARQGAGKTLALIGHFPFVPQLRTQVGELWVLEQRPRPGDLPAASAPNLLPRADVVAMTSTTLINHTAGELLSYCSPEATVILLGPSTPLSPVLFDHGVDILCGSIVTAVDPVLCVVGQGGNFRQVHRAGVRTVTMTRAMANNQQPTTNGC